MQISALTSNDVAIVEKIRQLSAVFQERAEEADQGGPLNEVLRSNIHHLARMNYFALRTEPAYGGLGASPEVGKTCLQLISAACGVTAFTQQQLHAGSGFIGANGSDELKRELLPQFASGENLCGVGFSHLRRPGPPLVTAVPTAQGYTINGTIPWITAWDILNSFILGATVNDGTMIFCYLPIKEFRNSLTPGKSMELSVMTASDTVELQLSDLKLPSRYALEHDPADHMTKSDYRGIAGPIDLPLGCARGSASYLRSLGKRRGRPRFLEFADRIEDQADGIDAQSQIWNGSRWEEPEYFNNAMAVRTGAIKLAIRAASAGVAATSGSAHLLTNPAQRRFRESAFYATAAQTADIQNSLLEAFIDG